MLCPCCLILLGMAAAGKTIKEVIPMMIDMAAQLALLSWPWMTLLGVGAAAWFAAARRVGPPPPTRIAPARTVPRRS